MKLNKINTIFITTLFTIQSYGSDYDNASFENYVTGQGVNEVILEAQEIICSLAKLRTEDLAGDGSYIATIFSDECVQTSLSNSTDSSQGTGTRSSAQSGSSSSSASSNGSATAVTAKDIDTTYVNSGFTTSTTQTTKAWILEDAPYNEETNRMPKHIVYIKNDQTAGISSTSKYGDFTLKYQAATKGNTEAELPDWYECGPEGSPRYNNSWCKDGADLGRGLMIANNETVKARIEMNGSEQQNMVADFRANGDIAGIYTKRSGFQDESLRNPECDGLTDGWWECQSEEYRNSSVNVLGVFAFGIQSSTNTLCSKMSELYQVNYEVYNEETREPGLEPYTLSDQAKERLGATWDINEKCFSIAKADAIKNVFDYGVYNADGSTFKLDNQAFPIKTSVTINDQERRVHGYASYWGVHVQDEYQQNITNSTVWTKDNDSDSSTEYNVVPIELRAEAEQLSFIPLSDLNGLKLNFWANDEWWSDEFKKIGFPGVEPRDGKFEFKSNKAVFTDYNDGSASDPLNYNLYGEASGSTYLVNLNNAKIDKDNLLKIIENDPNDTGKVMNLTMEFNEFPDFTGTYSEKRQDQAVIWLCTGDTLTTSAPRPESVSQFTFEAGQKCLRIAGNFHYTSDGSEIVLSSIVRGGISGAPMDDSLYQAMFYDADSGTRLDFDQSNWNNASYVYDMKITKAGVERPAALEIKLADMLTRFSSLSQFDNDGGNIGSGLRAFVNSSDTFTFLISSWINFYDRQGNKFNKIKGTFEIASNPDPVIYVDDSYVTEGTDTSGSFLASLSKAQGSDVTLDYTISSDSTATSSDYSSLTSGTVTIPAGQTSASITYTLSDDTDAEGVIDETIKLTLSNPSSGIKLGREEAIAYIYDNDANRTAYEDYIGTYNAANETFTVTTGLKFDPSYEETDLTSPFTFTATDWLQNMKKTQQYGDELYTEYRELNTWSSDTNSNYTIGKNSFENPTDGSKTNGIAVNARSSISQSDLPTTLYCLNNCISATNLAAHYADVKSQADPAGDGTYTGSVSAASPSPYSSTQTNLAEDMNVSITYDAGTENENTQQRSYQAGDWMNSIIASELYTYTVSSGKLLDADGNEISVGFDWGLARPYEKIRGANFVTPDGWSRETEWGIDTNELVDAATLAKLECDYVLDSNNKKDYQDENPKYDSTTSGDKQFETRYCIDKMWGNREVESKYSFRYETYKNYIIQESNGTAVAFDPPKTLYFTVPNESKYGNDQGKKFSLDYQGDHLGGIPGNVVNIDTGEVLGEWVEEWKQEYRWVPRFTIGDDTVLTDISGTEYKVKALRGEEWLGKKDSAIGSLSDLLTAKTPSDLITSRDLDFELSNTKYIYWDCIYKITQTDEYGNTWEDNDYEKCNAAWDSDNAAEVFVKTQEFDNCQARIDYEISVWSDRQAEWAANDPNYTPPARWQDDQDMSWLVEDSERCQFIGDIPSSFINNDKPSVVNGEVIYDPTPSSSP